MGTADQHRGWRAASGAPVLHLLFPGEASSVRRALKTALAVLREMPNGSASISAVEIVLAEVLNNVVEHAYGEHGRGMVELDVELDVERGTKALLFAIRDEGQKMPGDDAPAGKEHDLGVCVDQMPEGGFGWFLIRELTEVLRYRRIGERNELTFRITLDTETPEG